MLINKPISASKFLDLRNESYNPIPTTSLDLFNLGHQATPNPKKVQLLGVHKNSVALNVDVTKIPLDKRRIGVKVDKSTLQDNLSTHNLSDSSFSMLSLNDSENEVSVLFHALSYIGTGTIIRL